MSVQDADVVVLGRPYKAENPGRPFGNYRDATVYTVAEFDPGSVNPATETVIVILKGDADETKKAAMNQAALNVAKAILILREKALRSQWRCNRCHAE